MLIDALAPVLKMAAFYRASYKPHLHKILLCQSVVSQEHQALLFVFSGKFTDLNLSPSTGGSPFSRSFLHKQLEIASISLFCGPSVIASQRESLIL